MALESGEKIKLLNEYMMILKHDLFFLMAEERKLKQKPGTTTAIYQKIITIKREIDKAAQERMRLIQYHYGNINKRIARSAISA